MVLFILGVLLVGSVAQAASLDVPTPHTTLSGVGVIHGWKCEAGELTVRFDGGPPLPLLHGAARADVLRAGACNHANVGFVSIMNWGELGDGTHTAVVYDDGVEFDRSTFDVATTGEAFLRDAAGQCLVEDFPAPGEQALFTWSQPTQHMELAEVGPLSTVAALFDGTWTMQSTSSQSTFGSCDSADRELSGLFFISHDDITGTISNTRFTDDVVGLVGAAGEVNGHWVNWLGKPSGVFTGALQGQTGSGDWSTTWCSGTWTASKL